MRDFLLGREPGDYDIATSALPEQIERLFKRTIPVGRKFGVMVVVEGGRQFQVATFRAEADYQDGRHPERVAFGDAEADARRRDFTVNGLFYDPVREAVARLGRRRSGLARQDHPHHRLARGTVCRGPLAAAAGGAVCRATGFQHRSGHLRRPEGQRGEDQDHQRRARSRGIGEAVPSAARGPRAGFAAESGLLEQVLPEIAATITCEQSPDFHPEGTVFNHLRLMLQHLPPDPDPSLPWAVLLHDVAKPVTASADPKTGSIHFYGHEKIGADMAEEILERLRFPRKQIEEIVKAVRYHMQFKDALQMRKSTLRRLLMRPTFPLELELHRLDCLGSHGRLDVYDFLVAQAKELEQQPQIRPPLLKGDDLIALGMKPGPALGALLAEIREKQLQDELKTKAEARKWAKERIAESGRAGS